METNKTDRNRSTRMHIGDTILGLLERYDLPEITISQITKTAGISRMTFYHYFETKEAALTDYLAELIHLYQEELKKHLQTVQAYAKDQLVFTLNFFARYERFLLGMEKRGYYHLLIQGVNQFLETYYKEALQHTLYQLYFYAGAFLNVFMEWIKGGKKETAEEIAEMILQQTDFPPAYIN